MSKVNFELSIPSALDKKLKEIIDPSEFGSRGFVLRSYRGKIFNVKHHGKKIIGDKELYDHMSTNFTWLMDYLKNENPYEKNSNQFESKISHLLGVTKDYLSDSILIESEPPDLVLDFPPDAKTQQEDDQTFVKTDTFSSPNNIDGKVNTYKLNGSSPDYSGVLKFDLSSLMGNLNTFDNLKKILEPVPNAPDITDTLLYQYMKPRSGPFVDTSEVERVMFSYPIDLKMANLLRTAFEKSSLEAYIKLVNQFSSRCFKINREYVKPMTFWKTWILNGFHLIFYGNGSNSNLLNAFSKIALSDSPNITINAYAIKGSDSYLWNYLSDKILDTKTVSKSEGLKRISRKVESFNSYFYIIIHGIDLFLLNDGFNTLKDLIALKNVKVIGSMNHQNSGPIFNDFDRVLGKYRIVHTNTFHEFGQELISIWQNTPPNFFMNKKVQKSAAQIQTILEALSKNHQKLFSLIAQIQLETTRDTKKFIGIEKNSILHDSRAITICHNETKLDNLLTEFTTHDVIEQTRGPGGRLFLRIPFENEQLDRFII
ncbi:Origin recognition complex subunit 2 family protein [Theileria parva strain Muguga]|uniref:Origin recognition complex subunit 2 family protein n=1 Tax=Theileria parva strain Muguga TaxID=333668 RepID=UPI001C6198FD|nr:Origin recognition complex subunit 2 family protein [Theileria parva strain Muguga]EAN33280.2 Origin recognition complex subunit 2 family protein [Theileria parva strain Muguga]